MNKAGLGQAPMEGLSKYAGSVPGLARGGIVGRAQQFTSTPWRNIEGRIEAKAKPALDEMHTGLGKLFGRGDTFNGIAHAAMGTIKPRVLAAFRRADEAFRALMGGGLDSWGTSPQPRSGSVAPRGSSLRSAVNPTFGAVSVQAATTVPASPRQRRTCSAACIRIVGVTPRTRSSARLRLGGCEGCARHCRLVLPTLGLGTWLAPSPG